MAYIQSNKWRVGSGRARRRAGLGSLGDDIGGSLLSAGTSGATAGSSGGTYSPSGVANQANGGGGGGGGAGANAAGAAFSLIGNLFGPKPQQYYAQPVGPDPTTVLLIGGVGLVGLYFLLAKD